MVAIIEKKKLSGTGCSYYWKIVHEGKIMQLVNFFSLHKGIGLSVLNTEIFNFMCYSFSIVTNGHIIAEVNCSENTQSF